MRNTKQKEFVLNFIKNSKQHPSINQIMEQIQTQNLKIGRTTVYRILHNLTEAGFVKKIITKDGITHYDYNRQDHIHLVCNSCGKIHDIPTNSILSADFQSLYNFSISPQDIALFGLCKACNKKNKSTSKYKNL